MNILDVFGYESDGEQPGFVPGRGTNMVAVPTIGVLSYRTEHGSPAYTRSLDVQGMFDAIEHENLF